MPEKTLYTVQEAASYLDVPRLKIYRLIKANQLEAEENPMDRREKLIRKEQLDKIKTYKEAVAHEIK